MKKLLLLVFLSVVSGRLLAQIPEDVLKYSWGPVNGSARTNAIGGAMGSLGGDISSLYVNPAGLGFYKTMDITLSPGMKFFNNKADFRGTDTSYKGKSRFNLGPTGIVFGWPGNDRRSSTSIGIAINRTANFGSSTYYRGQNDFSSYGEQYAAEAAGSGLSLDDMLNSSSISLGTKMALYSYLIDTVTLAGNTSPDIVSLAQYNQLVNGGNFLLNQEQRTETKGGVTDLSIGFASNSKDKFYFGGSIGIPITNYEKNTYFIESDATNDPNNYFGSSSLSERYTTKGVGLNVKLGAIFKPVDRVRLGLAVNTPTWSTLTDTYQGTMITNTENYNVIGNGQPVSSSIFTGNEVSSYDYSLSTPWKFIASGTYILNEVADVSKQKGFISADIEYVTHRSSRFSGVDAEVDDADYYASLNSVIKSYYKNAFNFRVGGELKFTTFMTRLGFSYYGNPYSDKDLKANKMFLSGGLGYRNKGFFVDLTYVHALEKDISFPYRLSDKANTYANLDGRSSNVYLTFGIKI